jgi:hypothetical protein
VARSEIGSNRKNRANRFLTVIQYCQDMTLALVEMRRICGPRGHIIMIVGRESAVKGTRFFNGDIVARLAERCAGLRTEKRQERVFRNRFGEAIYEDILHFAAESKRAQDPVHAANRVAREVLMEALPDSPRESRGDLKAALAGANVVMPSPIYAGQCANARASAGGSA